MMILLIIYLVNYISCQLYILSKYLVNFFQEYYSKNMMKGFGNPMLSSAIGFEEDREAIQLPGNDVIIYLIILIAFSLLFEDYFLKMVTQKLCGSSWLALPDIHGCPELVQFFYLTADCIR